MAELEHQKDLEAWILKQEKNDEQLYLHIQRVRDEMASQQEKAESDKIKHRSTLESLIGEFQHFKIDLKRTLKIQKPSETPDSDDELASLSSEFSDSENLRSEIFSLKLEQKKMAEEMESFKEEVQLKVENALEADKLAHEAMLNWMKNDQKKTIAAIESDHKQEMKGVSQEILDLKRSLQVLKEELHSAKQEKMEKVEELESFEKRFVHQFCLMKVEQNTHKQEMENCREEMLLLMSEALDAQKLDYDLKLNRMENEQKKMMELVKAENKHEMKSFRGEVVSKLNKIPTSGLSIWEQKIIELKEPDRTNEIELAEISNSSESERVQLSSSKNESEKIIGEKTDNGKTKVETSSSVVFKPPFHVKELIPIRDAIIGDWKLVDLSYRNDARNTEENNNRIDLIRFQIFENTLISYFFDGHDFRELRREFQGTPKCRANHWRIEAHRIESVHFHGCPSNARMTEYSTRYIENGQLVVINEMGGCVCTKFYEKVQ